MDTHWAAAATALALVVLRPLWSATRHVVTLVHEAGHAAVAVATGRRLNGIRLHSDTSGLTITSGLPRGPGMVATAAAGYLAPSLLGLAGLALVERGHTLWSLWAGLMILAAMLVFIRNGGAWWWSASADSPLRRSPIEQPSRSKTSPP